MYYTITLVVYAAVDVMACLGLSQQFGISGVTNFGFIIFQAAGAYAAAILALPSDTANGGFQSYIGGLSLPFPFPLLGAAAAGALLAVPFVFLFGRRLRGDFAAIGLLVAAVLANLLVMNYRPFLNGDAGLAVVPAPLTSGVFVTTSQNYEWGFAAASVVVAALTYWLVRQITESPYGRTLRAMRDNDRVADALGKNLLGLRASVLIVGGAIAGLSGGLLVSFLSVWAPGAWTYAETIVLFAAVIIGGRGNHLGAVVGALLVPVGFEEVTRLISNTSAASSLPPNLLPSLAWVAIGLLIVGFLWMRPEGLLPERKRVIRLPDLDRAAARREEPIVPLPDGERPTVAKAEAGASRVATPDNPESILVATGLSRSFGGVHAVADVSLSIQPGRMTGLIGPNGAGKSTLLALLAGTDRASAGRISYRGRDVTNLPSFRRARMGLVRTFQLAAEFKRLTVLENLLTAVPVNRGDSLRGALAGRWYWRGDEASAVHQAADMLRRFGLEDYANHYAGDLSGGQRRMVEIMRALMARPRLLLLDEPMAGIHPELARRLGTALRELCEAGLTVLMVEHELAIMDEFCDPVIVMAEASVLAQGTMAQLRERTEVVEAYLVG